MQTAIQELENLVKHAQGKKKLEMQEDLLILLGPTKSKNHPFFKKMFDNSQTFEKVKSWLHNQAFFSED